MSSYCGSCGQPCGLTVIDAGIGPYEYAGALGVDRQPTMVSDCCKANAYKDEELLDEAEQDLDFDY